VCSMRGVSSNVSEGAEELWHVKLAEATVSDSVFSECDGVVIRAVAIGVGAEECVCSSKPWSRDAVDGRRWPERLPRYRWMRLTNVELPLYDSFPSRASPSSSREAFTVRNIASQLHLTRSETTTSPADHHSLSQWHAPPSPALTPRSSPQLPPTARRTTHGHDSTPFNVACIDSKIILTCSQ
jgi:hypothetical protein